MKRIISLAILSVSILPLVAQAEEHSENYVGISASKLTSGGSSTGAGIVLGHRYNEHWAAEIAYDDSGLLSALPERTSAISIAAVGYLPLVADLEAYGRLGYASASTKDGFGITVTHGDVTCGVGVEYRLNEEYALGFGWNQVIIGDNVDIPRANENSYALTVLRSF